MATATSIFDGHDALSGMEGGNPSMIGASSCANAVNRSFRGGYNRTRSPYRELTLTFANDDDEQLFHRGNVQGAFFYTGKPPTTHQPLNGTNKLYWPNYLIASVAGTVFGIKLVGRTGTVTKIKGGNNPLLMHTWFEQGYEWLFTQNGEQNCLIWNGQDATNTKNCFRSQPTLNQIPTGSLMAFIYGRMVVTSADGRNQMAVGDVAYGNHQNNSSDIFMFTDQTYWAEGGYFDIAAGLGDIMGVTAMPYLDTGSGQNELVVLCRNGATSFDFSGPRTKWLDSQVQRISLIGMGCESSHSLALVNGDLVYKSKDGIRTYRNSRQEFASGYTQAPISFDVDKWLDQENKSLLEFSAQISWNNMLFSTVMPMLERNETDGYGYHRYHRGMVVMDFQTQNKLTGAKPVWYGLWTGIRPTALVQGHDAGVHRAFAFSYDCDGNNRIYEFADQGDYDYANGEKRAIVSLYDTPMYCGIESNRFSHKRLAGGNIELSGITDPVGLSVRYKPDNAPEFVDWKSTTVGCECVGLGQNPSWERKNFGQPKDACIGGSKFLANIFRAAQFRIKLTGAATINRFGITLVPKEQTNTDNLAETSVCAPPGSQCPESEEFGYLIVQDCQTYKSEQTAMATCPTGYSGSATATASATSAISQEDADAKAMAAALAKAKVGLICVPPSCSPSSLASHVTNGISAPTWDLSAYFAAKHPSAKWWSLYDNVYPYIHQIGPIADDGTLLEPTVTNGSLNWSTKVFTDGYPYNGYMTLEIGCYDSGVLTLPSWRLNFDPVTHAYSFIYP